MRHQESNVYHQEQAATNNYFGDENIFLTSPQKQGLVPVLLYCVVYIFWFVVVKEPIFFFFFLNLYEGQ